MSSDGSIKLHHAVKTLRSRWELTTEQWHDPVARDFEANHLLPLAGQAEVAIRGMEQLSEILNKMKRDCS